MSLRDDVHNAIRENIIGYSLLDRTKYIQKKLPKLTSADAARIASNIGYPVQTTSPKPKAKSKAKSKANSKAKSKAKTKAKSKAKTNIMNLAMRQNPNKYVKKAVKLNPQIYKLRKRMYRKLDSVKKRPSDKTLYNWLRRQLLGTTIQVSKHERIAKRLVLDAEKHIYWGVAAEKKQKKHKKLVHDVIQYIDKNAKKPENILKLKNCIKPPTIVPYQQFIKGYRALYGGTYRQAQADVKYIWRALSPNQKNKFRTTIGLAPKVERIMPSNT